MPLAAIILSLIAIGVVMWFMGAQAITAYLIGLAVGITLTCAILRRLASKCQRSAVCSEIFYKITKYRAKVYNVYQEPKNGKSTTVYADTKEYDSLLDVLKNQMGFPSKTAQEAAKHAMTESRDLPLEDKIRVAIKYAGNGN